MSVDAIGLPTPTAMIRHVQQFDLAYRRAVDRPRFGRKHVMLIGPTGCGKTLLLRELADYLKVPIAFATATGLVEDGYVGEHLDSVLHRLVVAAGNNVQRAQCGILFIDEIDKIRRRSINQRDVAGEGVQTMLLPLLDGAQIKLDSRQVDTVFNTANILIVAAGAFVGLADIIRRRTVTESVFGFASTGGAAVTEADLLPAVENEDLIAFGLIPEFLGRFATIETLAPLDTGAIEAVLTESKHSALAAQKAYYRQHGVELTLTRGAVRALAERAVKSGTNARGAERLLLECLKPIEWQLPDLAEEGVTRVLVDEEVAYGRCDPRVESTAAEVRATPAQRLRLLAASLITPGTGPLRSARRPIPRPPRRPPPDPQQPELPF